MSSSLSQPHPEASHLPHITPAERRRRIAGLALVASGAIMGLSANNLAHWTNDAVHALANNDSGPSYTAVQYRQMPYGNFTFTQAEPTVTDAIRRFDPKVLNGQQETLSELQAYVGAEVPGGPNASTQPGETVRVPIVSGEQDPPANK